MASFSPGVYDPYDRPPRPVPAPLMGEQAIRRAEQIREQAIRRAEQILRAAGVKAKVVRTAPDWKPGDVVVIRYGVDTTPYTYVRGSHSWPGEMAPKNDSHIDALYEEGKVTPVLQAGGEAFDQGRM